MKAAPSAISISSPPQSGGEVARAKPETERGLALPNAIRPAPQNKTAGLSPGGSKPQRLPINMGRRCPRCSRAPRSCRQ
ncbi:hypothetical protein FJV77_06965 [Mesorhizobium sp. WSM4306]|nr:hypothetical protein FJV77_06965 [Mesorhizobium sp. WSM4306]